MLVAALGFVWMAVGSMGLELPLTQGNPATEGTRVSANLFISTYLILTFAELLLSLIGISFVSKVAPPKYAGLMMGLWFGATAIQDFPFSCHGSLIIFILESPGPCLPAAVCHRLQKQS